MGAIWTSGKWHAAVRRRKWYAAGCCTAMSCCFRGSQFGAVATVVPKPGVCVPVLVWKLRPSDERALDLYEGYPHLYRKENLSVTMDGGNGHYGIRDDRRNGSTASLRVPYMRRSPEDTRTPGLISCAQ